MALALVAARDRPELSEDRDAVAHKIRDLAERGLQDPASLNVEEIGHACFALHVLCCLLDHDKRDGRLPPRDTSRAQAIG